MISMHPDPAPLFQHRCPRTGMLRYRTNERPGPILALSRDPI